MREPSRLPDHRDVAKRLMFVQLKTGHDTDLGPCWISFVRFNRSWKTVYWRGKTLRRWLGGFDSNYFDVDTDEEYWLSGPIGTRPIPATAASSQRSTMTPARHTRRSCQVPHYPAARTAESQQDAFPNARGRV